MAVGIIEGDAARALRYRSNLRAEDIAVFAAAARSSAAVNSCRVISIAIRSSLPSAQENQNLNALGIPSESETMALGIRQF